MRATSGEWADGRTLDPELLRHFGSNRRGRCAGIDRELKRTVPVCVHLDEHKRFGRARQAHWDFRLGYPSEILDPFRIIEPNLTSLIIDGNPEMFQEIVTHITIDFRADGFSDVIEVDDANIDILDFCLSERKRIDLRQRDRNFSTRALAFFCSKNFDIQSLREFSGKQ